MPAKGRVSKQPYLVAFKGVKQYTNAVDNITVECLLAFLRDIGSDGNLSRVPAKAEKIYEEFRRCQGFVEDCLKFLKNLLKEDIVPSQRVISGLSKILESPITYIFFVSAAVGL